MVATQYLGQQVAGNLNVVVVGASDATAQVQSVRDTKNNSYVKAVGPTVHSSGYALSIYYAANILAAAAGANTVTVTFAAAVRFPDIRIAEYAGIDPANPLDGVSAAQGNSATSDSGALTTSHGYDLLVGANQVQTVTSSAGPNYSDRLTTSPNGDILEDRFVTATGSYNATAPLAPAGPWVMQVVAFRGAANAPSTAAFVNQVVVQNLNFVPAMVFLPDGKMFVGEIGGTVRVVLPGATQPESTPVNVIPNAVASGDAGLEDLTLDPNFAQNGYYYVYFARSVSGSMRDTVSRFTATADWKGTVAGSEFVVWQDDPDTNVGHHGASVAFGPDGKIYISTGEHDRPSDSQSLTSYRGKVLRVNPDGTIPADNPFVDGPGGKRDEIWAYGLRNPYRFSFDAVTANLYLGDVGGNDHSTAFEEVNLIVRGANYGWPLCEGPCTVSGVTSPMYSYPHQGRDAAIMGGFIYRGSQFPTTYQGNYFFADYAQNWLKRLTLDSSGTVVTGVFPILPADGTLDSPAVGDPVQLRQGPDGALYYLDLSFEESSGSFNSGTLRKVTFQGGGNRAPIVAASASPSSGQPPLTVQFSSAGTSDPDGDPLTYSWTFGDGGTSTEANPVHTYQTSGRYAAMLTVSDGVASPFTNVTVVVGNPPHATILSPIDGSMFRAGQRIQISGDGTDPEDGTLPDSAFTWSVIFHHDSHVHPGIGPVGGVRNLTFDIPTSGHDFSGFTRYEVQLTVVDSDGLPNTTSVFIFPDKVNLNVDTVPSGLTIELDGISKTTPFTDDTLKGFQHTLNAPNQAQGSNNYEFVLWSDGGAQSHGIVAPDTDTSYVATYRAVVPPPNSGLLAAYGFNEGAGTTTADASGKGHTGAINGATWTNTGKYGKALSFNGTTGFVDVGNAADLQITGSMTWSAWIFATGNPADDGQIISKSSGSGWQFKTSPDTGPHTFGIGVSPDGASITQRYSTTVRALNTWYFVSGVYDATARTLNIYVNGALDNGVLRGTIPASQFNATQNVNIGRRAAGYYFQGTIDEVRMYNRALTALEIQNDMNTAIAAVPDTQAPSAPSGLTANGVSASQINLAWNASTDNVGVKNYLVERCAGAGCTDNFTQIATPTATSYSDAGLPATTTYGYRVRATDAANNLSGYSNIAYATTLATDTQAPSAPTGLTATAASPSQVNLAWTGSTDNVGVKNYLVERCAGATCTNFLQIAAPTATSYSDSGLSAASTYRYRVRAADAANNLSGYSNIANATTPGAPAGLIAAYAFTEGAGTTTADASGKGHTGTITGATWTTTGRYGKALSFDGTTSYVNLGNAADLQITGSMTWSAWIFATGNPADDGQIIAKSTGSGWQFKTSPDTGPHTFGIGVSSSSSSITQRYSTTVRALNTWYHVAGVYDATARTLNIYVNGVLDNGVLRGTVPASQFNAATNVNIGRRAAGYYFKGTIDEVRVYNRALSQAEIQADMNTAITAP